jgi:hypothetical protein
MNSIRLDNGKQPDDDLFLFLYETCYQEQK